MRMTLLSPNYQTPNHKPPKQPKKNFETKSISGMHYFKKIYHRILTKKRVVNNGHVPQYYVENNHEAIIPREIYLQVQEEMMRRANIRNGKTGKKRVYSSKSALSSIVFFKECEGVFQRVDWNNRGCRSIVWRCVSRLERKRHLYNTEIIREDELHQAILQAINEVLGNIDNYLNILIKNIETVLNENSDKPTADIYEKLEELQMELLRLANSKEDSDNVAEEIIPIAGTEAGSHDEKCNTRGT